MSSEPRTADPALPPSDSSSSSLNTSNLPINPGMPGSEKSSSGNNADRRVSLPNIPTDVKTYLQKTDSTITRLNTLLKTPGGLASFLSTTNYALYILAHIHITSPTRAQILTTLRTTLGLPAEKTPAGALTPSAPTSPLLPLALTLADLRTTLRLTGLIPLYVLLKSLIKSQEKDRVIYGTKLAQCASYMTFQLLENINHLTNKTVVSANWTNSRFARLGGHAKLMTWSCRAWLSGITFDLLRLAREAQLTRGQGSAYSKMDEEERRRVDRKWWSEVFVATSWYPMAVHYSVEGGVGLNLGMVGACGFLANLGNFLLAWEAAK